MEITKEFKENVVAALLADKENFEGSDGQFAKRWGMSSAVFSRLKSGESDRLLRNSQWLHIARELNVSINKKEWKPVRTSVFEYIEEDILFCKKYGKSRIFTDKNEIGKTFAAKFLARKLKNCFYVPCSSCATKPDYIRLLARTLGIDPVGTIHDIEENISTYLNAIEDPIVINDDPGDMGFPAFFSIKKFWDSTEGSCAWYAIGDEALRQKWENAMRSGKIGYKALYSRHSSKFGSIIPTDKNERRKFYRELVTDVLKANAPEGLNLNLIISKIIVEDEFGNIGGLRRAESLLILRNEGELSESTI